MSAIFKVTLLSEPQFVSERLYRIDRATSSDPVERLGKLGEGVKRKSIDFHSTVLTSAETPA
jgi:hypothetical protein